MGEKERKSQRERFGEFRKRYCDYKLCKDLKGSDVKAIAYCPVCNKFLCGSCQIIHGTTAGTKNHQILIKEAMQNYEDDETPKYEYCSTHTGYRRDLFCLEHKEMVCSKCRMVTHKRCVVKFIQEAAMNVNRVDINALKEEIRRFKRELAFATITIDGNVRTIEEQRRKLHKENQETYDILIANLSKLFENIATEIDKTCDNLTAKLAEQKTEVDEIISSLESDIYAVEIAKDKEMSTNVFIGLQGIATQTRKSASNIEDIFKHFGMVELTYKPSKQLSDILTSAVHFVSIDITTTKYENIKEVPNITFPVTSKQPISEHPKALKFIEQPSASPEPQKDETEGLLTLKEPEEKLKLTEKINVTGLALQEKIKITDSTDFYPVPPMETRAVPKSVHISTMKARLHQTFSVKIASDRYNCWIRGSVITRGGNIILTDSNNHNVKLFTHDMRLLSYLTLSDAPWDISIFSHNVAVVSILKQNELQFIDFSGDSLKVSHILKLQFDVFGVTKCSKDRLCVTCLSDPPSVKLIDKTGKVYWYLSVDTKGRQLFRRPWYITSFMKDNGIRVVVTDKEAETISYIDGDTGKLLNVRQVKGKDPNGVTADYSGNIYVCYHGTDKICVMSGDLTKGRVLLSLQDGLRACPYAIAYDPYMSRLVISNNSSKMDSYKLS